MADFSPVDLQKALAGADYPADREQLTELARKNKASKEVVDRISSLDADNFENPAQVSKAVFGES
jgi:hypothetical protein